MYTIQNLVGYYFSGRNKNYPWTTVESNALAFEIAFRHVKATADRKQKEFVDRYHLKG